MAWSFNPFTGNLDISGSGAVVFEGEVATFADLPVTIGDPAVGAAFLVRDSTGVWLVNRRQAGIYIRRNNAGLSTDWEYAGDYPVNSVNGQSGNVVLGAADVGAAAATHASTHHTGGTDALAAHQINGQTIFSVASVNYSADQTLPANRARQITISNSNAGGITVTLPTQAEGTLNGDTYVIVGGSTMSGPITVRTVANLSPLVYNTLVTITATGQRYCWRSGGGSSGNWSLVPVDTHTHAAADVTSGELSPLRLPNFEVKTSNYTALTNEKVAADTTSGAWTLTLPATPSNGDTITVLDYAGTFDTNNLTIARNGSNIESLAEDLVCEIEDAAFTLVFVGSTVGWKVVPYFGNKTNFASPDPIGSSVPNTGAFTTLTANNGTLTASAPVLDLAQTWNNAAVEFTGLRLNVTDTASAANGTRLLDLQVGGVSQVRVERNTLTWELLGGGTNDNGIGFGSSFIYFRNFLGANCNIGSNTAMTLRSDYSFGFSSTTNPNLAPDVVLNRDAADTLAQRRTTNAQTFRIYNTFTDANNHERGFLRWSSNVFQIGTEKGSGGGTARNLVLQVDGVDRITCGTSNITFNGSLIVGSNASLLYTSRGDLTFPANGVATLRNSTFNDFDRLQFGGTTSSFPALKRSSTTLQVRLADDSAYSVMDAQLRAQGTAPATTGATGTAGDIRYDADYIYVCTAANTWKRAAIATW
jgi:hypothetical protein